MSVKKISDAILGIGVDDTTIDLFESQYPVPTGVSYNSYVILDEKTAVLDTVDARATEPWLENLTEALAGRKPDYLVVSHMEPDHGANVAKLAALYPEMQVVGNAKTFLYMEQFFGADAIAKDRRVVVKDGESLSLGAHTLTFVFAPIDIRVANAKVRPDAKDMPDRLWETHLAKHDRARASYYNYYTENRWGEAKNYDLCLNAAIGQDACAQLIVQAAKAMEAANQE